MNLNTKLSERKYIFGASVLTIILVGLLLYFFVFTGSSPTPNSPVGQLAVCLNERGATMYGLPTCPHCQDQKEKFGDSFRYIDYVNCSENRQRCLNNGIETVPTWTIDGENIVGVQELSELAERAGCEYP